MKKAWIENNVIRDIAHSDPMSIFHKDVAINYSVDVPDTAENGATLTNGTWVNLAIIVAEGVIPPKLTPIEFKMCFTSQERIDIQALKATDPVIADAYLILDDMRLTEVNLSLTSNIALIDYLATKVTLLTPLRVADIKAGKIL